MRDPREHDDAFGRALGIFFHQFAHFRLYMRLQGLANVDLFSADLIAHGLSFRMRSAGAGSRPVPAGHDCDVGMNIASHKNDRRRWVRRNEAQVCHMTHASPVFGDSRRPLVN